MKVIQIVYFCLALLPAVIYGITPQQMLHQMAVNGKKVNNIFKPALNGSLGQGGYGFTYKGTLLHPTSREVAMKFTPKENRQFALKEHQIYQSLKAKNNQSVEAYGIPTVYYFDEWKCDHGEYYVMAITLLDTELNEHLVYDEFRVLDVLITFREFVRIMKYIHSHNVHHNDIKIDNFMFRKHQCFIIDYNKAEIIDSPSKALHYAKQDWESFLVAIGRPVGAYFSIYQIKNWSHIMQIINEIESDKLRTVFAEFARYLFENSSAFYDRFYQFINDGINEYNDCQVAVVSWLNPQDKDNARRELRGKAPPIVSSNPFE